MLFRSLIATDEPPLMAEPLLDPIVVEDSQSDGGLADSTWTYESNWSEALGQVDYLLDQPVASKDGTRWRGWRFSGYTRLEHQVLVLTGNLYS